MAAWIPSSPATGTWGSWCAGGESFRDREQRKPHIPARLRAKNTNNGNVLLTLDTTTEKCRVKPVCPVWSLTNSLKERTHALNHGTGLEVCLLISFCQTMTLETVRYVLRVFYSCAIELRQVTYWEPNWASKLVGQWLTLDGRLTSATQAATPAL